MRRAKIVCTIGPASRSEGTIRRLIEAGMDVARLNFSHGTREEHARAIETIRRVSERMGRPVAILQDLQGPKIRTGRVREGAVTLRDGQAFTVTARAVEGTEKIVSTTYGGLAVDVRPGDRIRIDDGLIELEVRAVEGPDVRCTVVGGGVLRDHKGMNFPGVRIRARPVTEKDRKDLAFGIERDVDYVAISFVRSPEDVLEAKELLADAGADLPVIAKIEKPEAVEHLDGILDAADGVMVARGDLGVEMAPEQVPMIQKRIIEAANRTKVLVITATQMLESMTSNPRPTRAEASDVANAVFDGTDAVMLSGETAIGEYPVETVEMMARIVTAAEASAFSRPYVRQRSEDRDEMPFPDAIGEAASRVAENVRAKAIVAFTQSGYTARLISKYRPRAPIMAFTPREPVLRRLCLYWGVVPRTLGHVVETDRMVEEVEAALLRDGSVREGDALVILSGAPIPARGTTNLLKLHRIERGSIS